VDFSTVDYPRALLPLKKGGRKGFWGRQFQYTQIAQIFLVEKKKRRSPFDFGFVFAIAIRSFESLPFLR
jgi:hypothetical protein